MKITVEIDSINDLEKLLDWRDALRDRIATLEREPLRFSLEQLAKDVVRDERAMSLTTDQKDNIVKLIERGVL